MREAQMERSREGFSIQKLMRMLLTAGMVVTLPPEKGTAAPMKPVAGMTRKGNVESPPMPGFIRVQDDSDSSYDDGGYDGMTDSEKQTVDAWLKKRDPNLLSIEQSVDKLMKELLSKGPTCNEDVRNIPDELMSNAASKLNKIMEHRDAFLRLFTAAPYEFTEEELQDMFSQDVLDGAKAAGQDLIKEIESLLNDPTMAPGLKLLLARHQCLVS